jgi:hypothetical protein
MFFVAHGIVNDKVLVIHVATYGVGAFLLKFAVQDLIYRKILQRGMGMGVKTFPAKGPPFTAIGRAAAGLTFLLQEREELAAREVVQDQVQLAAGLKCILEVHNELRMGKALAYGIAMKVGTGQRLGIYLNTKLKTDFHFDNVVIQECTASAQCVHTGWRTSSSTLRSVLMCSVSFCFWTIVAFFRTFIAKYCPACVPDTFRTRNTCKRNGFRVSFDIDNQSQTS